MWEVVAFVENIENMEREWEAADDMEVSAFYSPVTGLPLALLSARKHRLRWPNVNYPPHHCIQPRLWSHFEHDAPSHDRYLYCSRGVGYLV